VTAPRRCRLPAPDPWKSTCISNRRKWWVFLQAATHPSPSTLVTQRTLVPLWWSDSEVYNLITDRLRSCALLLHRKAWTFGQGERAALFPHSHLDQRISGLSGEEGDFCSRRHSFLTLSKVPASQLDDYGLQARKLINIYCRFRGSAEVPARRVGRNTSCAFADQRRIEGRRRD
jgi:hypothetical protein